MPTTHHQAALILVGHGSTINPDSSAPTHRHADEIRRRGEFAEVVCAFWKEEPSLREVYYMLRSKEVYIVPNFISEGYFCQQVLPRELRLDGPVTHRAGLTLYYCDPVGVHEGMTKLLLKRADEVAPGIPREQTSVIIVGHGTNLNENSRKVIEKQVALIRDGGHGFAEVLDAYMEEAPLVAEWASLASSPNVVVVPFFIADGLHSFQDIPVLLGIESEPGPAASQSEVFRRNPYQLHGRNLYYSSAIGTEELMADVVLDQVRDFDAKHRKSSALAPGGTASDVPTLPADGFILGQLRTTPRREGGWAVHHVDDHPDAPHLVHHHCADAAREIAACDDAGAFRPLKTAPNLKHGWCLHLQDDADLRTALDWFYPAALGFLQHWQAGQLQPVHLRETLGRQTGMYRFVNTIRDDQAHRMVACECDAKSKCLRRITWQLESNQPLEGLAAAKRAPEPGVSFTAGELPLLCVEACTHLVSAARSIAQTNFKAAQAAG